MQADGIVVVSLCYIFHEDKVLVIKRSNSPYIGFWAPPGGKMELSESPEENCIREIQEETGLTIVSPQLRGIQTVIDTHYHSHWLLFIFQTNTFTGKVEAFDTIEGELRWVDLADLHNYPRPPADLAHWPHILSDDPNVWQGKFVYEGTTRP